MTRESLTADFSAKIILERVPIPSRRDASDETEVYDLDVIVRWRRPVTSPVGFPEEIDQVTVSLGTDSSEIDRRAELETLSPRAHLEMTLPHDLARRGAVSRELPEGLPLHA